LVVVVVVVAVVWVQVVEAVANGAELAVVLVAADSKLQLIDQLPI
jgi:hypothetical protein